MPPIIEERESVFSVPGLQNGLLNLAIQALSNRALVWCASLGGAAVWGYTVFHPEPWRMLAAVGYSLCLFVPILVRDAKG